MQTEEIKFILNNFDSLKNEVQRISKIILKLEGNKWFDDYYVDDIESFEHHVASHCSAYYRGDTDYKIIDIPFSYFDEMKDEEIIKLETERIQKKQEEIDKIYREKLLKQKLEEELRDQKEYTRLKNKYEREQIK